MGVYDLFNKTCLKQVDPNDLPTYSKGGHMIGRDVILYERTSAEMVRSFTALLPSNDLNYH